MTTPIPCRCGPSCDCGCVGEFVPEADYPGGFCRPCREARRVVRPAALDDEAFGRAWARQQGVAPPFLEQLPGCEPAWHFLRFTGDRLAFETDLPYQVRDQMRTFGGHGLHFGYPTEAAAYAALGAAVRAVHAAVPPLKEMP